METDEIARYLDALEREGGYRLVKVMKSSDAERTELVTRESDGEKGGLFVRKTIKRDLGLGSAYEHIFRQQQAGAVFSHIPIIHECYLHGEELVVVMDWIEGQTLQDLIYESDPSPTLAEKLFGQICDAVEELHEAFDPPLIHRDLKPSNVMIARGKAWLIDFGIAREMKRESETDTTHFGTRAYAPPEQFGYGQTTVRSDVYALGMLLYYCLTEQTPRAQIVSGGFDDVRIPAPLRPVLQRACAFDPDNRYASTAELKQAAANALAQARAAQSSRSDTCSPTAVQPAYPARTHREPPSSARRLISSLGLAYNIVIVAFALLFCAASAASYLSPDWVESEGYRGWFDAFGMLFAVPAIALDIAVLLLYKRPIAERFPRSFGRLKRWHYLLACFAFFCAVLVLTGIASMLARI